MDDILILHKNLVYIKELANQISNTIQLDKIGQITIFLDNNININYKTKQLTISQINYTNKILNKFINNIGNIDNNNNYNNIVINNKLYKPTNLSGKSGIKYYKNIIQTSNIDIKNYQKQIGSLLYLVLKTRSDIIFTVINCICFISNPDLYYFDILANIWYYLLYYNNYNIIYNCNSDNLYIKDYCNTDWNNNLNNRRSTTGYLFSLSNNLGITNPIL